jgi:hypothetical protein
MKARQTVGWAMAGSGSLEVLVLLLAFGLLPPSAGMAAVKSLV